MAKKRIAVLTATRAEYGILRPLIERFYADRDLEISLLVTGAHLSEEFGNTYREILRRTGRTCLLCWGIGMRRLRCVWRQ